jgi:hypothetical protein
MKRKCMSMIMHEEEPNKNYINLAILPRKDHWLCFVAVGAFKSLQNWFQASLANTTSLAPPAIGDIYFLYIPMSRKMNILIKDGKVV